MANIEDIQVQMPSGETKSYVVAGAILSCSQGSQLSRMKMPVSHGVFAKGKPQMNVMDFKPLDNIMPFGQCSSMRNPAVASATAANNGVLTPMPCMPVLTMPWLDGKPDKLVEGFPALLDKSTNMCLHCGQIKVEDDGQNLGGVSITDGSNACPAPGANAGQAAEGQSEEEHSMWGDFVKGISALGEVPAAMKKAASELPGAVQKAARELPGSMQKAAQELPKGVKQFVKEGYVDPVKEDIATLRDGQFTKDDVFAAGGMVLAALTLGRSKEIGKLQRTVGNTKKNKKGLGKSGNTSEVASNGKKAAGTGKNNREVNETFDYRKVNKQTNGRGETLATRKEVKQFKKKWEQLGIPVIVDKKGKVLKDGYEAAFNFGNGQILIKKNPTIVNLYHEGYHAEQWMDIGKDAYMKLSRLEREEYVFEQILKNRHLFDEASIGHSLDYIERLRNKFK